MALAVPPTSAFDCFVQSRTLEFNKMDLASQPLQSLDRLLSEFKEMYFLCRQDRRAREGVRALATRTIEVMERGLFDQLHLLDLHTIQTMTRWGLSQGAKDQLLNIAVRRNVPLPIIQHLVRCGADKHQRGWLGRNLLMIAAMHADQIKVQYFIDQGLNPRARDALGNTAVGLAMRHRDAAPGLAALPVKAFFPLDEEFSTVLFGAGMWFWIADVVTSLLPIENRMILQEIFSVGYTGFLAPMNSLFDESRDRAPGGGRGAVRGGMEGLISLSYLSHVIGFDSSGITSLVYLALSYLAYRCLDPATFNSVFIDYISPLAKCINVASTVAMVFTSCHPVYATVNLALYTISLLNSYGYLPVPIQKVYYCGLRALQAVVSCTLNVIGWVVFAPCIVVTGAVVIVGSLLECCCRCICCCRF